MKNIPPTSIPVATSPVKETKTPNPIAIKTVTISEMINPFFGEFSLDSWSKLVLIDKYAETTPVITRTDHSGLAVIPPIPLVNKSYPNIQIIPMFWTKNKTLIFF